MSCIIQGTDTGNLELKAGTNQSIVFTTDGEGTINLNALATKAELTAAVATGINDIIDGAPSALNTLNEIAAAIADDENFAAGVATLIGTKANSVDVYTKTEIDQTFAQVDVIKQDAFVAAPTSSLGQVGDVAGMIAINGSFLYYCVADYDGSSNIWSRVALTLTNW